MSRRILLALVAMLVTVPVLAQQQPPGWFVPGQGGGGGQRPPQTGNTTRPPQPPRPPQTGNTTRPPAPPLAPGASPPAPIIGVVDVQEVQRLSSALNQVREEIDRRRARLNELVQREQVAWRDAQQVIAAERTTLTPEQVRQRERDLQDRITTAQQMFRERERRNAQIGQEALTQIEAALVEVIRQVATSRNINLVLQRPIVILSEAPFDLTEEVATLLNRAITRVTLPPEEEPAPAPGGTPTPPAPRQPPAPAPGQPRRP